ncbi:MAG: ATP-dependent 6-phosphofructokinase [Chthoniobacteraceae bacterium]|nr:ATP-dependent 6-phosphofructokinase [Chthoniobacteraceae bacterium]
MQTAITSLGPCSIPSPLTRCAQNFRRDNERVLCDDTLSSVQKTQEKKEELASFEVAGARSKIFFDPRTTKAGIVTCGGLCPGLNDVIRGLVMVLCYNYGIKNVYGFRYGYEGLVPSFGRVPEILTPEKVASIHKLGGTMLGSSRGPQDVGVMVDTLVEMGIDILFVIGGDGSLRGAGEISDEILKRGLKKAVVCIPKTIDNDIMYVDKCFGFETAVAEAGKVILCAHAEAQGALNGIGLVKLMGRDSGFIACLATLACAEVNYVLIPEVPFKLEGPGGLFEHLHARLNQRKHAVIVVAEGAGKNLVGEAGMDASGNKKLEDIGTYLRDRINGYFKKINVETTLKYIDPSYTIRSVPASTQDNVYCSLLAQHAVHAAMAGKTAMLIGRWHGRYVHMPIDLVTHGRRKVDPQGELWQSVVEITGQSAHFQ